VGRDNDFLSIRVWFYIKTERFKTPFEQPAFGNDPIAMEWAGPGLLGPLNRNNSI